MAAAGKISARVKMSQRSIRLVFFVDSGAGRGERGGLCEKYRYFCISITGFAGIAAIFAGSAVRAFGKKGIHPALYAAVHIAARRARY